MDGKITKADLLKALDLGKKAAMEIIEVQKKALKNKFEVKK